MLVYHRDGSCSDKCTCCHIEREVSEPTFRLTQSQYTDTRQTSPNTDTITPLSQLPVPPPLSQLPVPLHPFPDYLPPYQTPSSPPPNTSSSPLNLAVPPYPNTSKKTNLLSPNSESHSDRQTRHITLTSCNRRLGRSPERSTVKSLISKPYLSSSPEATQLKRLL